MHEQERDGLDRADFKILYDGTWLHDGRPIRREALAQLFSRRALVVDEQGCYWLKTPFERYPVAVEDVPYVAVTYEEDKGAIDFITNMQERVALGPDRPLELRRDRVSGDLLPYIEVRAGLYARLGRNVYYQLAQLYGTQIKSRGAVFKLGLIDDDE